MTGYTNISLTKFSNSVTMPESRANLFDVASRIAVVTGASSGIGLALSQTLARKGTNVVLVARRAELLKKECDEITKLGGSVHSVDVDLLDRHAAMASYDRICEPFGSPDIVINAAGINLRESSDEVSWESWDRTISLNLSIPFFFSR
ncbi:MAG: SDR family NAD(P)-dependent oxidoreductase, partial [Gammaproteobacteria bacterium]|nr:SDR family NAD(P)-dependent oxidoreductase [Gammaproteobacteria bacterium]